MLPGETEPPVLAVVVMVYAVTAVVEAEDEPPPQATSAEQRYAIINACIESRNLYIEHLVVLIVIVAVG